MKKLIYILFFVSCLGCATQLKAANAVAEANIAYHEGDYHNAVRLYQQALKDGTSMELCFNLGNAYYRIGNVPQAILYYEKAKKMSPMNDDIRHNIDIARAKTIDKMPAETELFFMQWCRGIQGLMSIDKWAKMAVIAFGVALLLFLAYLFMGNMLVRRVSFYASMSLLLLSAFGNFFAWQRKTILANHDAAIVMKEVVSVKLSPTLKSADACIIHEGTKVSVTDHDMKDWLGIRLSDGREGWVQSKDVEEI